MKAILMAGGRGTRMYPITKNINKHLLPVYNTPMIQFAVRTLRAGGIKEICIVVNHGDEYAFRRVMDSYSRENEKIGICYSVQPNPLGAVQGLNTVDRSWIGSDEIVLMLADNFFNDLEGTLANELQIAIQNNVGATCFTYPVSDPRQFGIYYQGGILEKPTHLMVKEGGGYSAITGLYVLDASAVDIARSLSMSERGEYEVTDLLREYKRLNGLEVVDLDPNRVGWSDLGEWESLFKVSLMVRSKYSSS